MRRRPPPPPRAARRAVAAAAAVALLATPAPGFAGAHLGQKVAGGLRSSGLPDWLVLMIISAMPVVELRGGIPVGIWMGLSVPTTMLICVAGNMAPIAPFLLGLRSPLVQKLFKPLLTKARAKVPDVDDKKQWLALVSFVGVPLPGTGAWTGAMIASILEMEFWPAMSALFTGVVSAGLIMSAITLAGTAGLAFVTVVLLSFLAASLRS